MDAHMFIYRNEENPGKYFLSSRVFATNYNDFHACMRFIWLFLIMNHD